MNRLAQLSYATRPGAVASPAPSPQRGTTHFVAVEFSPSDVEPAWQPESLEDAPRLADPCPHRIVARYSDLPSALRHIREFNSRMTRGEFPPAAWSAVAEVETGPPSITESCLRSITPLLYTTIRVPISRLWKPASLLDVPRYAWCEEVCPSVLAPAGTLDEACRQVITQNASQRAEERRRRWSIVVAFEAEALSSVAIVDYAGSVGRATRVAHNRFHLVDTTWPIHPSIVAEAQRGGVA